MLKKESTEKNDTQNWVKKRLLTDKYKILEFEGYTVKSEKVTGLFDRRMLTPKFCERIPKDNDLSDLPIEDILNEIRNTEENLESKISFAKMLGVRYRYVFYTYEPRAIYVYTFEKDELVFKVKYDDYCEFIKDTFKIRDLKMSSPLQEKGMPMIDTIFRDECKQAWMGNLDGIFITNDTQEAKVLVEFQTTKKVSVKEHSNNKYFTPTNTRKGDEQRWKVIDILSKSSGLPCVIIVWSPNKKDVDIKYKVIDHIVYSQDANGREVGLHYSKKEVVNYEQLKLELDNKIKNV